MVGSRHTLPSWMSAAASRVDFDGNVSSSSEPVFIGDREPSATGSSSSSSSSSSPKHHHHSNTITDFNLGFGERAFSAAGAAVLSAILVNPLDVAKTRLQAQAAGVPYSPPQHHVRSHMASLNPNTPSTRTRLWLS